MTVFDAAVLAILLLSALFGALRGFTREALGLLAWIAAAVLAARFTPLLLPSTRRWIGDDSIADPVSFVAVFAVWLILFLLVATVIGNLVRFSLLGGIDRLFGFGFGLLRGAAILVVAFLVVVSFWPPANWPAAARNGRTLPLIRDGAGFVAARLPERFRPDLFPATASAPPAAGDRTS